MGINILSFNDVIELNKVLEEKGMGCKVHLHDRCGSQSFSIERLNQEQPITSELVNNEISLYFNKKGMTLKFSENNMDFVIL